MSFDSNVSVASITGTLAKEARTINTAMNELSTQTSRLQNIVGEIPEILREVIKPQRDDATNAISPIIKSDNESPLTEGIYNEAEYLRVTINRLQYLLNDLNIK